MQERSEAERRAIWPRCLAKGAKRPSHTTNTIKFDRIPIDPCISIKSFDLCPFDQKNSTHLQQLPVTWLDTIWLNFFVELFGLKSLGQVTTKLSQLHSNSRNKYVNSRKYHNVGQMRCMHARPHRRKDQLPLRSLTEFVPARSLLLFDLA